MALEYLAAQIPAATTPRAVFLETKKAEAMNEQGDNRQSNQKRQSYTILQRIGKAESDAVEDCVSVYGNLVWALARKFAPSTEEAEKAARDIFNDIWESAPFYDSARQTEEDYILQIAVRRLIKQSAASSSNSSR